MSKSPEAFRTISEVAEILATPAHVLRFWESRFPQIRPVKRAGGRRYYRPADVALLTGIKKLLHEDCMTIRGVQKILREKGIRHVAGIDDRSFDADDDAALEEALSASLGATGQNSAKPNDSAQVISLASAPRSPDPVRTTVADEVMPEGAAPASAVIFDLPPMPAPAPEGPLPPSGIEGLFTRLASIAPETATDHLQPALDQTTEPDAPEAPMLEWVDPQDNIRLSDHELPLPATLDSPAATESNPIAASYPTGIVQKSTPSVGHATHAPPLAEPHQQAAISADLTLAGALRNRAKQALSAQECAVCAAALQRALALRAIYAQPITPIAPQ